MEERNWNVEKLGEVKGHTGAIYDLMLSTKKGHVLTASGDRFVAEWNIEDQEASAFSVKDDDPVFSLLHLPANHQLLLGNAKGELHVLDLKEKTEIRNLHIHEKGLFHLHHDSFRNRVYSLGGNGSVGIWNTADFTLQRQVKIGHGKLRKMAISPDGSMAAISCQDGFIRIYDAEKFSELYAFHAHEDGAHALLFHPNKPWLMSGGKDAHIRIWDMENGFGQVKAIPAHNYGIYGLALSPDGKTLASVSRDATVKLWNGEAPDKPLRIARPAYTAHTHSVNCLLWIDNQHLVTAGDDRRIVSWKIEAIG